MQHDVLPENLLKLFRPGKPDNKVVSFPIIPKLKNDFEKLERLVEQEFHMKYDKGGSPYINHLRSVVNNVIDMFSVSNVGRYRWFLDAFNDLIETGKDEVDATYILAYTIKSVAIAHDLLEDTEITSQDLRDLGISELVISNIELLTKPKNYARGSYEEELYYEKIKASPIARAVKIADLLNNMDLQRVIYVLDENAIDRTVAYSSKLKFLMR